MKFTEKTKTTKIKKKYRFKLFMYYYATSKDTV